MRIILFLGLALVTIGNGLAVYGLFQASVTHHRVGDDAWALWYCFMTMFAAFVAGMSIASFLPEIREGVARTVSIETREELFRLVGYIIVMTLLSGSLWKALPTHCGLETSTLCLGSRDGLLTYVGTTLVFIIALVSWLVGKATDQAKADTDQIWRKGP